MAAPTQPRTSRPRNTVHPPRRPRTGVLRGRPRWFITLFGTDVWERFSFYGMTAILVLYATESTAAGGLVMYHVDAALL